MQWKLNVNIDRNSDSDYDDCNGNLEIARIYAFRPTFAVDMLDYTTIVSSCNQCFHESLNP